VGVLEETVEGLAVHQSGLFQLLPLQPKLFHRYFLLVDELPYLYIAVCGAIPLFAEVFDDLITDVLLALLEVALAAFAFVFGTVQDGGGLDVRTRVDLDDREEALRLGCWVAPFPHISVVIGGEIALQLHRRVPFHVLNELGLADGGRLALLLEGVPARNVLVETGVQLLLSDLSKLDKSLICFIIGFPNEFLVAVMLFCFSFDVFNFFEPALASFCVFVAKAGVLNISLDKFAA
jgi:hypothetical protein